MKRFLLGLCITLLAAGDTGRLFVNNSLDKPTSVISIKESLTFDQLRELAEKRYKAPIDAKIMKAGKRNVIPELNGLEVDIDATWQQVQKHKEDAPIPFVYRQVPPKIRMSDLDPMPIYQGNPEKRQVALMVNVAWGTEQIEPILQIFRQHQVKATFFLDGSWLTKNEAIAKKIVAEGHEIGNHAYSHPDMARLSERAQQSQIRQTQLEIRKRLGVESLWFAPPSGSYNETTVSIAHQQKMGTVLWTLDTVDWRKPPKEIIIRRILPNAKHGSLILMHPTEPTVDALRTLVPELQKKRFQLVTVSQLLSPIRYP